MVRIHVVRGCAAICLKRTCFCLLSVRSLRRCNKKSRGQQRPVNLLASSAGRRPLKSSNTTGQQRRHHAPSSFTPQSAHGVEHRNIVEERRWKTAGGVVQDHRAPKAGVVQGMQEPEVEKEIRRLVACNVCRWRRQRRRTRHRRQRPTPRLSTTTTPAHRTNGGKLMPNTVCRTQKRRNCPAPRTRRGRMAAAVRLRRWAPTVGAVGSDSR